jgi:hypothetical protein
VPIIAAVNLARAGLREDVIAIILPPGDRQRSAVHSRIPEHYALRWQWLRYLTSLSLRQRRMPRHRPALMFSDGRRDRSASAASRRCSKAGELDNRNFRCATNVLITRGSEENDQ